MNHMPDGVFVTDDDRTAYLNLAGSSTLDPGRLRASNGTASIPGTGNHPRLGRTNACGWLRSRHSPLSVPIFTLIRRLAAA